MATCERDQTLTGLELPPEFEDMHGLLRNDLKAVVAMVAQRANDRLMLTKREQRRLKVALWNNLTGALNKSLVPLSAENR